jgi:8-oxo-dGTP diphosphatase
MHSASEASPQATLPLFNDDSLSPIFGSESHSPTINELHYLFAAADWRPAFFLSSKPQVRFSPLAFLKARTLPYLLRIPSERALADVIREREDLRALCGFTTGQFPTAKMFWHFRSGLGPEYVPMMFNVLGSLAVASSELHIPVPFCMQIQPETIPERPPLLSYHLTRSSLAISVWEVEGSSDLSKEHIPSDRPIGKRRAQMEPYLPSLVRLTLPTISESGYDFTFTLPSWLTRSQSFALRGTDSLGNRLVSRHSAYNACNTLVLRVGPEGQWQVLLAARTGGTSGPGHYTIPGGKQHPGETLEECAVREVREETGLKILASRPVSIRRSVRVAGNAPADVWSIGVLAQRFEGEPEKREEQLSDWKWFDIDKLPTPMFQPAAVVIEDYLANRFPDLSWALLEGELTETPQQLPLWDPSVENHTCPKAANW